MNYYRLYFLSARSGRIERALEIEAPSDEAATRLALDNEGSQPLELWCRDRLVQRFEPQGAAASA